MPYVFEEQLHSESWDCVNTGVCMELDMVPQKICPRPIPGTCIALYCMAKGVIKDLEMGY